MEGDQNKVTVRFAETLIKLRNLLSLFRRLLPKKIRHHFPSIGKFVPKSSDYPSNDQYSLTRDGVHFMINRSDYVQWRIFYGVRDNALLSSKQNLEPSSVVLDIGANVGAFSLKLARYLVKNEIFNMPIHCFEPNPKAYAQLQKNLYLNPELTPVIHLHDFGLGNESNKKPFLFHNTNTGAGRIVSSGNSTIEIKKLDDFIDDLNPSRVSFIKMIVEGYEPEVLKGGWKSIKRFKPCIFFEVTPSWWRDNNADVIDVLNSLESLGYQFRIERYNELRTFNKDNDLDLFQFNLLAIPG